MLLETEGIVACFRDVAVMGDAIGQGGGHLGIAERGHPFAQKEIGGDNQRGSLHAIFWHTPCCLIQQLEYPPMNPTTPATLTSSLRVPVAGGVGYIGSHMVKHLPPWGCDVVAFDKLSTGYRDAVPGSDPARLVADSTGARLVPLARESAPRKKCLFKGRMKIGAEFGLQIAAYGDTTLIV